MNISLAQFFDDNFINYIESNKEQHEIYKSKIEIELNETAIIENFEDGIAKLNELRKLNIETNIDDFGTGHSSMVRLKMIPFNTFKIDRCFVKNIETDSNAKIIIETMINLAHNLHLKKY